MKCSMALLREFQIDSIKLILKRFGGETSTSIENAVVSVSCAKLCLNTERPDCTAHAKLLFKTAASNENLEVLEWGEKIRYELNAMFDKDTYIDAALKGHLEVVKYLLGIPWDVWTCVNAARGGHLELL